MPASFTIYGVIAYSLIASLFLIIKDGISGNRFICGLKFTFSCCVIWSFYPLADCAALLIMRLVLVLMTLFPFRAHFFKLNFHKNKL